MGVLRVRDIMTEDVLTLPASMPLEEAAAALSEARISGAPVVDGGRIVGVLSKSDLSHPRVRHPDGALLTVSDVMTPAIWAVRAGDVAMSAVRLMVEERIHRTLVVDGEGRIAGIVSAMDVLEALARGEAVQDGDRAFDARREWHSDPAYVDVRAVEIVATAPLDEEPHR